MPTTDGSPSRASGALLLCRAEATAVGPAARLLRTRVLLLPAGRGWSLLVPEGRPLPYDDEPVDRFVGGWAVALAVAVPCPVLALWWDEERSGYTLASGFRRSVGYEWLANGTPVGEDEAMRTFAARLGLDPVLDMQSLDGLTRPDPAADARARLRGLLAVLTRVGVALPAGLAPGVPADRLYESARVLPHALPADRAAGRDAGASAGRGAADGDAGAEEGGTEAGGRPAPARGTDRVREAARAVGADDRALAVAHLAAGVPVTVWGVCRRSAGWTAAGTLLLAHGALGLARVSRASRALPG
ncbi:hypothetical protein [Streptomyces minutiscleroticus]|uniref:Uncharacterized protein n=1 Tax=Streptomyces minutiscleroticus TaxID=68238 RepID=A0A918KAH4_9ACTN|nr:hypothetical protein [Streptomyces minutiscleroticus]GGX56119.1 hypothetical protein GCM10010358_07540 [Streptomyces minutiscleroticus]